MRPVPLLRLTLTALCLSTPCLAEEAERLSPPSSLEERLRALEAKDAERAAREAEAATQRAEATAAVTPETEGPAPFAFADFSWAPGNAGSSEHPYSFGPFTGELLVPARVVPVDPSHAHPGVLLVTRASRPRAAARC
jgi:hypothetical protein